MATVKDVCIKVRSKNAGPFWVTVDFFFKNAEAFERYAESSSLCGDLFARLYGADASQVKRFAVASLHMLKVSYPRPRPQGGEIERDMHSGQQYVRLLGVELG